MNTTIYYASDVHGSNRCFSKFLNAAKFYKANVLVMGGDVLGKAIIFLEETRPDIYVTQERGQRLELTSEADVREFEKFDEKLNRYTLKIDGMKGFLAIWAGDPKEKGVRVAIRADEIANGIEYGLSSALYTKDVNKAFSAIRDLYAGITYINAPTIGAEVHLPFGGTKATGNGHREGGIGAIDFYTEWKAVYVDYSDKLQKAQIDRED